jgi:hypothetical protein
MSDDDLYVYHSFDGHKWFRTSGPYKEADIDALKQVEIGALQKYWNQRKELRDRNPGLSVQLGYLIRIIGVPAAAEPPNDLPPMSHEDIMRQDLKGGWTEGRL